MSNFKRYVTVRSTFFTFYKYNYVYPRLTPKINPSCTTPTTQPSFPSSLFSRRWIRSVTALSERHQYFFFSSPSDICDFRSISSRPSYEPTRSVFTRVSYGLPKHNAYPFVNAFLIIYPLWWLNVTAHPFLAFLSPLLTRINKLINFSLNWTTTVLSSRCFTTFYE